MRHLIIGKNSSIVKKITPLFENDYDLISHKDISHVDFFRYDHIFLFSWPKQEHQLFKQQIEKIPFEKLIFISTTAVLANQLRQQWNSYPNQKLIFEEHFLLRGSRTIRIGITNADHIKYFHGSLPFTSLLTLASVINNIDKYETPIIDAFVIARGASRLDVCFANILLWRISKCLSQNGLIQRLIQGLSKLVGLKYYGYTADSCYFFRDTIQIGYGALGSVYFPKIKSSDYLLLTSPNEDHVLIDHGFNKTRIGRSVTGLARLWHGVSLIKSGANNQFKKNVPIYVRRPQPPFFNHLSRHVETIEWNKSHWRVYLKNSHNERKVFFCNKLVLAAGPIQNVLLLQRIANVDVTLSDHEIAMIGKLAIRESIRYGLIRRKLIFIKPGLVISESTRNGLRFIVEARPDVPIKHHKSSSKELDFYLDSSLGIFLKLAKSISLKRLNEAIFNKFQFSILTKKCSIFVQVLVEDCIHIYLKKDSIEGQLSRNRLTSSDWSSIQDRVEEIFPGFVADKNVSSIDAQHVMGARDVLTATPVAQLIEQDKLTIVGSPTQSSLGVAHHTLELQHEIQKSFPVMLFLPKNPNASGCHHEHVEAIANFYGKEKVLIPHSLFNAIMKIKCCNAVYFQKSSPLNLILALIALVNRKHRILYVHEPLSISKRIKKGVPALKSILVTLFQNIETRLMTLIMTGNASNTIFFGKKLVFAPLLLPEPTKLIPWVERIENLLYFGRLDSEKCFKEFTELTLDKTIIATSNLNINNYNQSIKPVTSDEKSQIFQDHKFVWCVQHNSLTQSAVVIDALKFGCCCVLAENDPMTIVLHPSEYVKIPLNFTSYTVQLSLHEYSKTYPNGPCMPSSFSMLCGQEAFNRYWREIFYGK